MHYINILLLLLGFFFSYFITGLVIVQTFFKDLPKLQKLPIIMILSILFSTYTVYFVSLIVGYSRISILISFAIYLGWFIYLLIRKKIKVNLVDFGFVKEHIVGLSISLLIGVSFFVALYPAIFFKNNDYFVMSAVNWQDTAMHQSIFETISQGNFPPEAPYFSGVPLQYYYFVDFHSSILEVLYGEFFPRVLVYDNPFLVFTFSLAIYALAFYLTKNKRVASMAIILAVFASSFLFIRFLESLVNSNNIDVRHLLLNAKDLLTYNTYTLEFNKLFQLTPVSDYFLQNRPMMLGLPAIIVIELLLISGFEEKSRSRFFLAGIIVGMLVKFQLFGSIVGLMLFALTGAFYLERKRELLRKILFFILPVGFWFVVFLLVMPRHLSEVEVFKSSFSVGPWAAGKDFNWYLQFYFLNFNLPFTIVLVGLLGLVLRVLKFSKQLNIIYLIIGVLFIVPMLIKFTIYEGDMLKFYYFMLSFIAIIAAFILNKIFRFKYIGPLIILVVIVISSLTGVLTLFSSYLNKNGGYSEDDYQTGMWIRENTPQKAIFIEMPRVHSAVSDIGGRLKILSYTNWPYSHGFNKGTDNVFSRDDDIRKLYKNSSDTKTVLSIMQKYKAQYILYSQDEKNEFPTAQQELESSSFLRRVYDSGKTEIFIKI